MTHPYERSPHSGAGNCVCGRSQASAAHPHPFAQAWRSERCVCGYAAGHAIHVDAATASARPVPTGLDAVSAAVTASRGGPPPVQVQGYA